MKALEIHLKSGASFTVDCTEATSGRDPLGELSSLEWTTPEGAERKLLSISLSEVAAMVVIR